jgi:hypothetical protein
LAAVPQSLCGKALPFREAAAFIFGKATPCPFGRGIASPKESGMTLCRKARGFPHSKAAKPQGDNQRFNNQPDIID